VLLGYIFGWLLHVTPTTKPFIVVVFHEESNGCLVRWKLHAFFSQLDLVSAAVNHPELTSSSGIDRELVARNVCS